VVHIIAEAGNNHNGRIDIAYKLVELAKEAGADSVKFQIIYPDGLYLPKLFKNGNYELNEVYQKRFASMLKDSDYKAISVRCQEVGISFSASVFDKRGIDLLNALEVPYLKIASCDLNNSMLLISAAETGRKLVLSTGMATLSEIDIAVTDLYKNGYTDIVLMHCVSLYPANTEQTNLSFIKTLKTTFGFPVGFSDHTESSIAGSIAVSMGATWIEKHFTFDRSADGFDHVYAMEPQDFMHYVKDIRAAELACKRVDFKLSSEEMSVKIRARRGIYASRDISPGEVICKSDLLIVRPESDLDPNQMDFVVGRAANKYIRQYEAIKLGDI